MYEERTYRKFVNTNINKTTLIVDESDLDIYYDKDLNNAENELKSIRTILKSHIKNEPNFFKSLIPLKTNESDNPIIKKMKKASNMANVGPMASVAGAVSETMGKYLSKYNKEVIIENGGDIYINAKEDKNILINASKSPLSNKLYIKIKKEHFPLGICTSSGTKGHSLSFGNADAVVVISKDTFLSDALATAICNKIKTKDDINLGIDIARNNKNVLGIIIIIDKYLGAWGDIELKKIKEW